jgi:putative inorganic carbon (HCO3(-)) transporter
LTASAPELLGLLFSCGGAAVAVVATDRRRRYAGGAVALVAAPILLAGDVWNTSRVVALRHDPAELAGLATAVVVAIALLAVAFSRFRWAFPVGVFAALPLRVPVQLGGETSHLLVPLYLVVAGGFLSSAAQAFAAARRGDADIVTRGVPSQRARQPAVAWLGWILAATLILYAVQAVYSDDVSNAIENSCFFLVPFAVLFVLLREVEWTRQLLGAVLAAVAVMGIGFSAVAFWEYGARDLILNRDLLQSNQLHLDFRVNSVFFDPNVFGRYLALAIVAIGAYVAWSRGPARGPVLAAAAAAVMLPALALSYSITSVAALIAGVLVLVALRWSLGWGVAAGGAMLACGAVVLLVTGTGQTDVSSSRNLDTFSGGRGGLVKGGIELAEDRPGWGWGSGSFGAAFLKHVCVDRGSDVQCGETTVSHSEPLTVAAEQGAIGLVAYLGLVALSLVILLRRARASPAAAAIGACFVALLVHSLGYAGFAIDPATWALLGVGVALGARGGEDYEAAARDEDASRAAVSEARFAL